MDTHLSAHRTPVQSYLLSVIDMIRINASKQIDHDVGHVTRLVYNHQNGIHEARVPVDKFIKGPLPLKWIIRANSLPGKVGSVGVALWFLVGVQGSRTIKLTAEVRTFLEAHGFRFIGFTIWSTHSADAVFASTRRFGPFDALRAMAAEPLLARKRLSYARHRLGRRLSAR